MKKALYITITGLIALSFIFVSCRKDTDDLTIILATTTSTEHSGLLDFLLSEFRIDTGMDVKVIAVGTGKALQMGRDGEADVLLIHAGESEIEFVREGHGLARYDIMYNDFVLLGPMDDPADLAEICQDDIVEALKVLSRNDHKFISRGDDSGTYKKEMFLWETAGIGPDGDFYISAGRGMGDVLKIASELQAYTLSDRATFLNFKTKLELRVIIENDERLFNQYGIIPVNPDKNIYINKSGAEVFVRWMLSPKAQALIGEYGNDTHGASLFVPNAAK